MQRYKFSIQYNGNSYFGWQRQKFQMSIQEEIENNLSLLFNKKKIEIIGCGRTDTGVHAKLYVFHVDLEDKYNEQDLLYKLNKMCSKSISFLKIDKTDMNFHARFSAKKRTYKYFVHKFKDPFKEDFSLYFPDCLDINKMNEACICLIGTKDFTSFSKLHTDVKTNICTIYKAYWEQVEDYLTFNICADRFLRNMVRAIVGTLIEIGINKISIEDFKKIIEDKNRSKAKKSAPARALFLWDIEY